MLTCEPRLACSSRPGFPPPLLVTAAVDEIRFRRQIAIERDITGALIKGSGQLQRFCGTGCCSLQLHNLSNAGLACWGCTDMLSGFSLSSATSEVSVGGESHTGYSSDVPYSLWHSLPECTHDICRGCNAPPHALPLCLLHPSRHANNQLVNIRHLHSLRRANL